MAGTWQFIVFKHTIRTYGLFHGQMESIIPMINIQTITQCWKSSIKNSRMSTTPRSISSEYETRRGVAEFDTKSSLFAFRACLTCDRDDRNANGKMRLTMSVPKSMQRIVTVPRGRGISQRMNARKGEISGIFEVRVYAMDFFRLSKISRPSSTPVTIEAKLSSSRIMSAACLDTSEPAIPMATPMSAFFNAGESFTPSPGII